MLPVTLVVHDEQAKEGLSLKVYILQTKTLSLHNVKNIKFKSLHSADKNSTLSEKYPLRFPQRNTNPKKSHIPSNICIHNHFSGNFKS